MVTAKANAQFFAGAKSGLVISTFTDVYKPTPHIGYKVGVSGGYMFSNLGLETGIFMKEVGIESSEGYLPTIDGISVDVSAHIPAVYFEIPLSLLYKISIAEKVSLRLNGGCYLACGSYGNGYYTYYANSLNRESSGLSTFEDCYSSGSGNGYVKPVTIKGANRFDYGLIFGIGIEVANINFSANYDYGMASVYDVFQFHPESKNVKNRAFWIGLGYNFTCIK
jgi:hypothetical protein